MTQTPADIEEDVAWLTKAIQDSIAALLCATPIKNSPAGIAAFTRAISPTIEKFMAERCPAIPGTWLDHVTLVSDEGDPGVVKMEPKTEQGLRLIQELCGVMASEPAREIYDRVEIK